ncbi:high-affinity iron transporter, partial [Tremellales sp. Uapishka_1]
MSIADYLSPVAFFILLRETLEAGIIIAVLLGFVRQLVPASPTGSSRVQSDPDSARSSTELLPNERANYGTETATLSISDGGAGSETAGMRRQMKMQIWTGAISGGLTAIVIGGIFLYIVCLEGWTPLTSQFYTYTKDLWASAELLWEGGFCLLASILILVMGLAFLRLPHAQTKWRIKLLAEYETSSQTSPHMILFGLPFITVLREGLEGLVFLGGVGMSASGHSIIGGSLLGLLVGALLAYLVFSSSATISLRHFTTASTLLLFLIGSGLASRSAFSFERQYFVNGVGQAAAESGSGPGSYRVDGNIWKLRYGDPEVGSEGTSGWSQLANSLVGWNNVGTFWTVTTYMVYWWIIIGTLMKMKFDEGRADMCGRRSRRGRERHLARRKKHSEEGEEEGLLSHESDSRTRVDGS